MWGTILGDLTNNIAVIGTEADNDAAAWGIMCSAKRPCGCNPIQTQSKLLRSNLWVRTMQLKLIDVDTPHALLRRNACLGRNPANPAVLERRSYLIAKSLSGTAESWAIFTWKLG